MDLKEKHEIANQIIEVLKARELTVGEALEVLEVAKAVVESVGNGTEL